MPQVSGNGNSPLRQAYGSLDVHDSWLRKSAVLPKVKAGIAGACSIANTRTFAHLWLRDS